jgi:hypothetical protein
MARIVLVPREGEGSPAILDPIILAASEHSNAASFSTEDALANEFAARELDYAHLFGSGILGD